MISFKEASETNNPYRGHSHPGRRQYSEGENPPVRLTSLQPISFTMIVEMGGMNYD